MLERMLRDVELYLDTGSIEEIYRAKEMLRERGLSLAGITTNPSLIAKQLDKMEDPDVCAILNDFVKATGEGQPSFEPTGNYPPTTTVHDLMKEEILQSSDRSPSTILHQGEIILTSVNETAHHVHSLPNLKVPVSVLFPGEEVNNVFHGLQATQKLTEQGYVVNGTLYMNAPQALLGAAAGAKKLSIFVGRIDDEAARQAQVTKTKEEYWPINGKSGVSLYGGKKSGVHAVIMAMALLRDQGYDPQLVFPASLRNGISAIECIVAGVSQMTMPYTVLQELLDIDLSQIDLEKKSKGIIVQRSYFPHWKEEVFENVPTLDCAFLGDNPLLGKCASYLRDPLTEQGMLGFTKDALLKGKPYLDFLRCTL